MKRVILIAAIVVALLTKVASAQVTASVDFSAAKFTNLAATNYLYGPTVSLSSTFSGERRIRTSFQIRGEFLGSSQRYDGAELGPLVSMRIKHFEPYVGFLIGFARYNDGVGHATTDAQLAVNAGVTRAIRGRFGWHIFEYGYKQYYALGGQFNPKTFSTGLTYTLGGK